MAENTDLTSGRDMALLRERAERVGAFKARVDVTGMTRPSRAPEERAFFEQRGVARPFNEVGPPARRVRERTALPRA